MSDRYAVITQENLWHGSPRRDGSPGANMAGEDGRPLCPMPWSGLAGSDCIEAQRYNLWRLVTSAGKRNRVIRAYQVQRSDDLIARNLKRDIRQVVRRHPEQVLICPFYDPNLARKQRGWPFDAPHAIRAYREDRAWLRRVFARDRQAWLIDGRPAIIVWAGWTPGQHELCTELHADGWCVLLDYQGGWPDHMVPELAEKLRGSVDYVTGFTSNSPTATPQNEGQNVRRSLNDVTGQHALNMRAWRAAGIPVIPSLSPAYDDTAVRGDAALQVLYRDHRELANCICAIEDVAPLIDGYRTFGFHSGNCWREGTGVYDSLPYDGWMERVADDGLPERLGNYGTAHLDALREVIA